MARRQERTHTAPSQRRPTSPQAPAITSADMDGFLAHGQAVPLSQVVPFIVCYRGAWWLSTQAGWLPIAPSIAAVLDKHAERMRQHDAVITANQATIRTVIDRVREATKDQD